MSYFSDLKNDMASRWSILHNKETEAAKRCFAAAELLCFPASILTLILLLPAQIVAAKCGWDCPQWAFRTLAVLVSAAVGYITNYIAIEMLFKPYKPQKWLFLWPQGLIPRNKHKIGEELGTQVAENLLKPQEIADELCQMVTAAVRNPNVTGKLRDAVQNLLRDNMDKITVHLIPKIEESVSAELSRHISPQNIMPLWENYLAPKLAAEDTRTLIAREIVSSLQKKSPQLTNMLKDGLREYAQSFLEKKLPLGFGADFLANGLVAFIDWPDIEKKLAEKIADPAVRDMIRDELSSLADRLDEWLKTPAGQEKLATWSTALSKKFQQWLKTYLEENLPRIARQMLASDDLWDWIEKTMIPAAEPKIKEFIASQKDEIVRKLDIKNRVSSAIDHQDVREFHNMINSVAAEHLGAIQVLGFFLGAIIGLLQLLI